VFEHAFWGVIGQSEHVRFAPDSGGVGAGAKVEAAAADVEAAVVGANVEAAAVEDADVKVALGAQFMAKPCPLLCASAPTFL
jgi:hypothetical protein